MVPKNSFSLFPSSYLRTFSIRTAHYLNNNNFLCSNNRPNNTLADLIGLYGLVLSSEAATTHGFEPFDYRAVAKALNSYDRQGLARDMRRFSQELRIATTNPCLDSIIKTCCEINDTISVRTFGRITEGGSFILCEQREQPTIQNHPITLS